MGARIRHALLFAAVLTGTGLCILAWTLATPLTAAPDEPNHAINAAAVIRGQFAGPVSHTRFGDERRVTVPAWVADSATLANCIAFQTKPASCQPGLSTSTRPTVAKTQFSNYPPLYYALIGWTTLGPVGRVAFYWMRLASDAITTLLISSGLFVLLRYRAPPSVLVGLLVAMSPMVLFVSSVISDSAMETAAAMAAWCGCLTLARVDVIPVRLVLFSATSLVLLTLSRPLSPLYAGLILIFSALWAGPDRGRQLIRARAAQAMLAAVGLAYLVWAATLLAGGLPGYIGGPLAHKLDLVGELRWMLQLTPATLRQAIGLFGWLQTPAPTAVVWIWTVVAAGFIGLAAWCGWRPLLLVLALGCITIVVIPAVFEAPKIDSIGPYWQGRYWLPLLVGLPLMAACRTYRTRPHDPGWIRPALASAVAGLLIYGQVNAFLTVLTVTGWDSGRKRRTCRRGHRPAALPC